MRIGIDVRCLAEGRKTGVEEYTLNLLANLFSLDSKNEYVLFFNSFRPSKADFSWLGKYPNVTLKKFKFPSKLLNFLFWYFGWPKMDKLVGGTDLFFMPNITFGSVSRDSKFVIAIHDLSFERCPETFSLKRRFWHGFVNPQKLCRRSDKIIAVSESTKNDLISLYKIKPEKITRIYNGISDKFRVIDRNDEKLIRVKEKYGLPYKFILYLGTIEPRKNIGGVIAAYNQFQRHALENNLEDLTKYQLVIAGSKGWLEEEIFQEISRSEFREKIRVIHFVADEDKEYLYNLASLFVYPSFFEGFGFPPLEAMKCGVPTIVSNSSSLPEVAGGGAILVDCDKPDEIYRGMREVLGDLGLSERLREKGLTRAEGFNWQKTAEEFLSVISK